MKINIYSIINNIFFKEENKNTPKSIQNRTSHFLFHTSNSKGITLIALIITIVVMLILAGVAIDVAIDKGLITSSKEAKEGTEKAQYQKELEIIEIETKMLADRKGLGGKEYLNKYEEKIRKNELLKKAEITRKDEDTIIVETEEGYLYEITEEGVKQITDTNTKPETPTKPSRDGELAKDVLKTNPNAEATEEKSPYVKYNNKLWRVLYDSTSKNGLQLVSAESVGDIELGYNDTQADANEFTYAGEDTSEGSMNFKKAAASYNNVVDRLNKEAEKYITKDNSDIAERARSLGSAPDFSGDLNKTAEFESEYSYFYNYNKKFKVSDNLYEEDLNNVISLNINLANDSTWLASRDTYPNQSTTYIGIRTILSNEEIIAQKQETTNFITIMIGASGTVSGRTESHAFRPVILLKSGVKIIGNGDGTKNNPYELSL